jgi:hypothetical protein
MSGSKYQASEYRVGIERQERSVKSCYLALPLATLALPDRNDGQQSFSADPPVAA